MKNNQPKSNRRKFLKTGAFLGSMTALGTGISGVIGKLVMAQEKSSLDNGDYKYPNNEPENTIYSACLQCHTACPIKCKVVDGILVKIDGNPYCPQALLPALKQDTHLSIGAKSEGRICPKGQSGIETLYDPYRLRKVLKRNGARGSNKWETIPFERAVNEIVNGGRLFEHIGEDRYVSGMKDVFALRDPDIGKKMSDDIDKIKKKKMNVEGFQKKYRDYLDTMIDDQHPDFGPKNNQFVFLAGRIEHGRKELGKRFTYNAFGSVNFFEHTTICEQSHHIAYEQVTNQYKKGKWGKGKHHMKPDFISAEYVIFFGTGAFEANFGPPLLSGMVSESIVERNFKYAVVDPRLSKTAGKADKWIPVIPGTDAALAMGMIRWIIENERYDKRYLENANKCAAGLDGEPTWTTASYLVRLEDGRPTRFLRADEVGLGTKDQFVVSSGGELYPVTPEDTANPVHGELHAIVSNDKLEAKTSFLLLKNRVKKKTMEEYAAICGVNEKEIVSLADEFTSHGKKAAAEFYRGPVQHTNGYYNAQAIITLNILLGNADYKGGLTKGGGHWHEFGGKSGNVYDLKNNMHPAKLKSFGLKINREKAKYEDSSLFKGYPAKRPFYPFTGNLYQEVIPSIDAGYPYPVNILFLHMGTPVMSCPAGHKQIKTLIDTSKIPLFVASDIVIGETSMYADYIIPDLTAWERWGTPHITPAMLTTVSKVRQPAVAPLTDSINIDGNEMPICMESFLIALAKRLGLSGFGKDGFGDGIDFNYPEDFYLKAIANIAMGDKAGNSVPEASDDEVELFEKTRRHLPDSVFNIERWKNSSDKKYWKQVIHVLNRGGRFEEWDNMYKGKHLLHKFGKMFTLFVEPVAMARDSMTGKYYDGLPKYEKIKDAKGNIVKNDGYPLHLITYKEIYAGHSRTIPSNYWLGELMNENAVLINRLDADKIGVKDGDIVRVISRTNSKGNINLENGRNVDVKGKIKTLEGIRPGVVAISWHFGHWAYGSNDVEIDGLKVQGEYKRSRGILPNPVMLEDTSIGNVCLTDSIGGSASYYDTRVKLVRI